MIRDWATYDAVGLADLVRTGQVSALELLEAAFATIERENPALNAVVRTHRDLAEKAISVGLPEGRFTGVPFMLKDLDVSAAGTPLTSGSRLFAGTIAEHDSTLVARYRAAGLSILGRTNSAELGLSFTTEPMAFGPTRHPLDHTLSPGGSSGGSSAAVASRMVPMAHATDGGGSIRQPAALTGLFGLKPSRGRTPPGPAASDLFFGMSVNHALTRSVRDSAALLDATLAPEPGVWHGLPAPPMPYEHVAARDPQRLLIAVQTTPFGSASVQPSCLAACEAAGRLCEALGHAVESASPPLHDVAFMPLFRRLAGALTAAFVDGWAALHGVDRPLDRLEPAHAAWVEEGRLVSSAELIAALGQVQAIGRRYAAFFGRYDLILSPVVATAALPIGHLSTATGDLDQLMAKFEAHAPFTFPYNAAGCPAMSIPMSLEGGRPHAAQFAAAHGREDLLIALAGQIERAQPWTA